MCSRHISTWPEGYPIHMPESHMYLHENTQGWLCHLTVVTIIVLQSSPDYHPVTTQKEVLRSGYLEGPQGHASFVMYFPSLLEARLMLTGFPAPQGSVRKPHRDTSDFLACLPR